MLVMMEEGLEGELTSINGGSGMPFQMHFMYLHLTRSPEVNPISSDLRS